MNFIKRVFNAAIDTVIQMLKDIINNIEAVIILLLSTYGLTATLSVLPFEIVLPAFIDAPMVIPVLSVFIILALITSIEWRQNNELKYSTS